MAASARGSKSITTELDQLAAGLADAAELLDLVEAESDEAGFAEIARDTAVLDRRVRKLELSRMFPGEMDPRGAFLDIQAGAGGTEAQDWASDAVADVPALGRGPGIHRDRD